MNKPVGPREQLDMQAILEAEAASTPRWMQRRAVKLAGAALAGVLVVAIVWWLGRGTNSVRYVTEPATRGNLTVIVTATGSVQPTNKVDVSSELSGTIRAVHVDYNSAVKAGQLLAQLDTDKLEAMVRSSRARLEAAQAKVTEAEATVVERELDLDRKTRLVARQATSIQDLDQSRAARHRAVAYLASVRADVGVAEAEVRLNETNFAKAEIRSPIDGIVLTRNVDPGQTVASTLQAPILFSIAEDLRQMELQVDVDEADVGKVRVGQTASFGVDAFADRKFAASIREVRYASETIQGVVTYKAELVVDNSELLLRPGMTATAEIKVAEIDDALLIPNASLRYMPAATDPKADQSFLRRFLPGPPRFRAASPREETGSDRTVWVLRNGLPAPAKVTVGASDGKRTEVRDGELKAGETVIVDETAGKP
jgi:HlyD family secretion protein